MKRLCLKAREILLEEGNVQIVDAPVTVSSFTLSALLPSSFLISHLDMWRHSWSILRYDGAFQSRWLLSTDKLSLHGYIHFHSILFSLLLFILFQAILSIVVFTLSKPFCSFSLSKFDIRIVSLSYAVTTNLDKSRKSMGFTTNVRGNMEVVMSGDGVAKSLITSLLQLL